MRAPVGPQPPLPWVQTLGLTDFWSRPRHRFFEATSSGRRTKFSHVMCASENSDPRASGGCRNRGQGTGLVFRLLGPDEPCPTALSGEWGTSGPRQDLEHSQETWQQGTAGYPWGPRPGHTGQGLRSFVEARTCHPRTLVWVLYWSDHVPSHHAEFPSRQAHPCTPGATPQVPTGTCPGWGHSKEQKQVSWEASQEPQRHPSRGEERPRPGFVLGIRCESWQPWPSRQPCSSGRREGPWLGGAEQAAQYHVPLHPSITLSSAQFLPRAGRTGRSTLNPKVKGEPHPKEGGMGWGQSAFSEEGCRPGSHRTLTKRLREPPARPPSESCPGRAD